MNAQVHKSKIQGIEIQHSAHSYGSHSGAYWYQNATTLSHSFYFLWVTELYTDVLKSSGKISHILYSPSMFRKCFPFLSVNISCCKQNYFCWKQLSYFASSFSFSTFCLSQFFRVPRCIWACLIPALYQFVHLSWYLGLSRWRGKQSQKHCLVNLYWKALT